MTKLSENAYMSNHPRASFVLVTILPPWSTPTLQNALQISNMQCLAEVHLKVFHILPHYRHKFQDVIGMLNDWPMQGPT